MKRVLAGLLFFALFAVGTGGAVAFGQSDMRPRDGRPTAGISVGYFYDNLAEDGDWFQDPSFGWCWTPYDVSADWRPYSDGHWVYTDYGWSWASDESFGWATYHYGRWFFDDTYGWAWQPGTVWAPAWVAWRTGDDYVGWAPLPPRADWDASVGLSFGDADANVIPSQEWSFVPRQHLLDVSLSLQVTSVARNVTLLGRSRDATRFEVREGRPADMGIDVAQLEVTFGHPVPRMRIVDADTPAQGGGRPTVNGAVGFFRPPVQATPATAVAPPSAASRHTTITDAVMLRQRDEMGRKLESDLTAERGRLARDQENELRGQAPGAAAEATRKRQATEQQAFEAHAAQQRQVLSQRIQKRVVRPDNAGRPGKGNARPDNPGNGNAKPDNPGNGNGKSK